jgi:ribosomal protein RSM22 (predicted rRNA methylase)
VQESIEARVEQAGFAAVRRAAEELSESYRAVRNIRVSKPERVAAYLVTRMPATYAAAYSVLRQLQVPVESVLDVGAGSGAASLAARELFPEASVTMIEREPALAEAARQFVPDAEVKIGDATSWLALPRHDLVIAAYSFGEFATWMAERLWSAARVALVVIEPGSPAGFGRIRALRKELLQAGAHLAAPCPAEAECPMPEGDWCHFAARVERSSLHRRIKGGELSYEDEKFSYVAAVRTAVELPRWRVIRRPEQRPGLIVLETCTPEGLAERRVTKRDKEAFRAARKTGWGDAGLS